MTRIEEDMVLRHFAAMEAAYSALLSSLPTDESRSSIEVLYSPLSELFYDAYLEFHPCREVADVDLVEFLGGLFLLDSQGRRCREAASRVVGAIGVSQEVRTLRELLSRLRGEHLTGQSTERTLELIHAMLWNTLDTASLRKRREVCKAISAALGIERKGLVGVFEDIASRSSYQSSLAHRDAANLRQLSGHISECLQDVSVAVPPHPRKGQLLPEDFWKRLRESVHIADKTLPESKKAHLTETLCGFYSSGSSELLEILRSPTDKRLELVERYVCPVVDSSKGRPRNTLAQRRLRFKNNTKYQYDIGHFLPHSAGGPPDINFFIQERKLNRGWSVQGKRYRWLERMVLSHPGTCFFVRPVYGDLSSIPVYLEWGALLDETLIEELAEDLERMNDLHIVRPAASEAKFALLVSVFENFRTDHIREMRLSAGWTDGL